MKHLLITRAAVLLTPLAALAALIFLPALLQAQTLTLKDADTVEAEFCVGGAGKIAVMLKFADGKAQANAIVNVQLAEEAIDVNAYGSRRTAQFLGDIGALFSFEYQNRHGAFPRGQLELDSDASPILNGKELVTRVFRICHEGKSIIGHQRHFFLFSGIRRDSQSAQPSFTWLPLQVHVEAMVIPTEQKGTLTSVWLCLP